MTDVKISELPLGIANKNAIVPATNAGGNTTEKIKLGDIASLYSPKVIDMNYSSVILSGDSSGESSSSNGLNGTYYLSDSLDMNDHYFYSKDGLDSYPRIGLSNNLFAPGNTYWALAESSENDFNYYITDVAYPNIPVSTNWLAGDLDIDEISTEWGSFLTTDASLGEIFNITLKSDVTLSNPKNPVDGKKITWKLAQDTTGGHAITLGYKFNIPNSLSPISFSTVGGKMDILEAIYDASRDTWDITLFEKGYAVNREILANLLLNFNGANTSTTFTDSSSYSLPISAVAGAQISTTQSKFGGSSGFFDGIEAYLDGSQNSNFILGTDEFTLECWAYPLSYPDSDIACLFDTRDGTSGSGVVLWINSNTHEWVAYVSSDGGDGGSVQLTITSDSAASLNAWTHLAVVRKENSLKFFVDGVLQQSIDITGVGLTGSSCYIGTAADTPGSSRMFSGFIDDLRLVMLPIYTDNFTPPSSQLEDPFIL